MAQVILTIYRLGGSELILLFSVDLEKIHPNPDLTDVTEGIELGNFFEDNLEE